MKAPGFWYKKKSFWSLILWPLSKLYSFWVGVRVKRKPSYYAPIPVICVGNVVMGGAGKTPCVIAIVKFLKNHGFNPHIISRGYKGKKGGKVDLEKDSFLDVGDEACILAETTTTWVGKNRISNIKEAVLEGATHIVMDDGLQNPSVFKDLAILIKNQYQQNGNEKIFPAGPLREPYTQAVSRSNFILSPQEFMSGPTINTPLIAFAGIGYPEKFFISLKNAGYKILDTLSFPDHYIYTKRDVEKLIQMAREQDAFLATTTKDYIKLKKFNIKRINVFDVSVILEEELKNKILSLR